VNRTTTPSEKPKAGWRQILRKSLFALTLLLGLAMLLGFFAVSTAGRVGYLRAFIMPADSMDPTLLVGDHFLVKTFVSAGRGGIRRGEVVAFRSPVLNHPYYVKRVIALPGDRIKIVNSVVFVNGKRLKEPYAIHDPGAYDPFAENFPPADRNYQDPTFTPQWKSRLHRYLNSTGELVVPPGHYFVLGDNRDHSWDSRYWGFVGREAIFGTPILVYWSKTPAGVQWGRIFRGVR
jgi:signal peptidase I